MNENPVKSSGKVSTDEGEADELLDTVGGVDANLDQ
jgi:hypothetical protein